ncbi:MAG: hypothetical protein ACO1RA_05415 [Planctomycetaceae bacterium]
MAHLRNYLTALVCMLFLWGAYSVVLAPIFVPVRTIRASTAAIPNPGEEAPPSQYDFSGLFPEDAWELNASKVKVIETSQCTLLLEDYSHGKDGNLKLKPCTLIFYIAQKSPDQANGLPAPRRPVVLRAPNGADLQFDRPLNLGQADIGRLIGGKLTGQVTIFSPATSPENDDALNLTTRNITLDKLRVYTPHEVDLRYGKSYGRGQDLTIELAPNDAANTRGSRAPAFSGIHLLQLARVERLHWESPRSKTRSSVPAYSARPAPPQSFMASLGNTKGDEEEPPVEIRCQGAMVIDFEQNVCLLNDRVQVNRVYREGPPDEMTCQLLQVHLVNKKDAPVAAQPTSPSDSSAGKDPLSAVEAFVAVGKPGNPVVFQSPRMQIHAVAHLFHYQPRNRRVLLDSGNEKGQVQLQYETSSLVAKSVEYKLPLQGMLGELYAAGPGKMETKPSAKSGTKAMTATWQEKLTLEPAKQGHLLSFHKQANIVMDGDSRFSADKLFVWVNEQPSPEGESHLPAIAPDRMLATGNVDVDSPQLAVKTKRLEAWFIDPPITEPPTAPSITQPPATSRFTPPVPANRNGNAEMQPLVQPASGAEEIAAPTPPPQQKYFVKGNLVQMNLLRANPTSPNPAAQQPQVEDLTIRGAVEVNEIPADRSLMEGALRVLADSVTLRKGSTPDALMTIAGDPAQVSARGLSLAGGKIHLHRGKNSVWVDGPGEAALPFPQDSKRSVETSGNESSTRVRITWQGGLTFDGLKLRLERNVETRTETQFIAAEILDMELVNRVDFANLASAMNGSPGGPPPGTAIPSGNTVHRLPSGTMVQETSGLGMQKMLPANSGLGDVKSIVLTGESGVLVENISLDPLGRQTSFDTLVARMVNYQPQAGSLRAEGPGEVTSVRVGKLMDPVAGGANVAPTDTDKLTFIGVKFLGAIIGDTNRSQISFRNQVETVVSEVSDWHQRVNSARVEDLGESGAVMYSDVLDIAEMSLAHGPKWIELNARGNTRVDGKSFTARAARIGYVSNKDQLILEGDGRTDAELWHRPTPTSQPSYTAARKITYRRANNALEVDGGKVLDIGSLPPGSIQPPRR